MTHQIILFIHILFASIAIGIVSINAILFLTTKFSKKNAFDAEERYLTFVPTISTTIWLSLIILSITGILLFSEQPAVYSASSKFHLKMILVLVLFVEGILMSLMMPQSLAKEHQQPVPQRLHEGIMMLGIVSIVTWFGVFFLGWTRSFALNTGQGLLIYLGILFILLLLTLPLAVKIRRQGALRQTNSEPSKPMI